MSYNKLENLKNHIEALIFCTESPISLEEISKCLESVNENKVDDALINQSIQELIEKYSDENTSLTLTKIAGGFQFLTKPAYQNTIGVLLAQKASKRLTISALETLSIIAYKQPVSKPEIEKIRGVNCDYTLQKLLEKELIEIRGKGEGVGKPILYGTSRKFMEYFGINSMADLPTLKEIVKPENLIGEESIEARPSQQETADKNPA